jgi:hypothetical protein
VWRQAGGRAAGRQCVEAAGEGGLGWGVGVSCGSTCCPVPLLHAPMPASHIARSPPPLLHHSPYCRLTQNVIDGFGVSGAEGVYRRVCEITLSVLRQHKGSILR